jgi:hypothetical protein
MKDEFFKKGLFTSFTFGAGVAQYSLGLARSRWTCRTRHDAQRGSPHQVFDFAPGRSAPANASPAFAKRGLVVAAASPQHFPFSALSLEDVSHFLSHLDAGHWRQK